MEFFKGFHVEATASNTILYLNPIADKSRFSIYYHEIEGDTALSFDFELGSDATRINKFNKKDINDISPDVNQIFIQSMAGYKAEFDFTNLEEIQTKCLGKSINRVTIDFEAFENNDYPLHEKLYLLRENIEGKIVPVLITSYNQNNLFGEIKLNKNIKKDLEIKFILYHPEVNFGIRGEDLKNILSVFFSLYSLNDDITFWYIDLI